MKTNRLTIRRYRGVNIYPAARNNSGLRWYAQGKEGNLRADTLEIIRQLINQDTRRRSSSVRNLR